MTCYLVDMFGPPKIYVVVWFVFSFMSLVFRKRHMEATVVNEVKI